MPDTEPTTDTMTKGIPALIRLFAVLKDYGWLFVVLLIAVGFNFTTPAAKIQALTDAIKSVQDSLHIVIEAQKKDHLLLEWNANVTCHRMTIEERAYAQPCQMKNPPSQPAP